MVCSLHLFSLQNLDFQFVLKYFNLSAPCCYGSHPFNWQFRILFVLFLNGEMNCPLLVLRPQCNEAWRMEGTQRENNKWECHCYSANHFRKQWKCLLCISFLIKLHLCVCVCVRVCPLSSLELSVPASTVTAVLLVMLLAWTGLALTTPWRGNLS